MIKLVGRRILLSRPTKPESSIVLSPEMEAALEREMMAKWTHLEVYEIGADVTLVKKGNVVYIPSNYLTNSDLVELEDGVKLMVGESDIAIVWK